MQPGGVPSCRGVCDAARAWGVCHPAEVCAVRPGRVPSGQGVCDAAGTCAIWPGSVPSGRGLCHPATPSQHSPSANGQGGQTTQSGRRRGGRGWTDRWTGYGGSEETDGALDGKEEREESAPLTRIAFPASERRWRGAAGTGFQFRGSPTPRPPRGRLSRPCSPRLRPSVTL